MGAATAEKAAPQDGEKIVKVPSNFVVSVRVVGEQQWSDLPSPYQGLTQDGAKRAAAQSLASHEVYGEAITSGPGVQLRAQSVRSLKITTVKVEPQPAKVVLS